MTIKIASSSPSLTLVEASGGVRFVVHAFLTSSDFIFWWNIPSGQLKDSYFYGKDFVDALMAIRNGAGSAVVRYVVPGNTPAEDSYSTYIESFTVYGQRLSAYSGKNQVVNLSQNGDVITMATPVTATYSFNLGSLIDNNNKRVIECYQDAARGENNALCSFTSNVYIVGTFFKE